MTEITLTYTKCNTCGTVTAAMASMAADHLGWIASEDGEQHFCPECQQVAEDLEGLDIPESDHE